MAFFLFDSKTVKGLSAIGKGYSGDSESGGSKNKKQKLMPATNYNIQIPILPTQQQFEEMNKDKKLELQENTPNQYSTSERSKKFKEISEKYSIT